MLLFCEECGASNDVDPQALENMQNPVRCAECGDILNKSRAAIAAAAAKAAPKAVPKPPAKLMPALKKPAPEYVDFKEVVRQILAQYPT